MSIKNGDVHKVLAYLENQNRPYSLNDVFLNLHKEIGKTAIQKCLDQLVASDEVKEKIYGKQKVYVINQSKFPTVDDAELKQLEREVAALSDLVNPKLQEVQQAEVKLKSLLSTLTTEDAVKQLEQVAHANVGLEERLQVLKQQQPGAVSGAERQQLSQQHARAISEWRRRRRLTKEVLDVILEGGYPNPKQQLYEEIGIETDEDAGVVMPSL